MSTESRAVIFGPMRVPFLILNPACVMLGTATAVRSGSAVNLWHLLLAFLGAVSAHISVNALNEYHDYKSGLDFTTRRTPFSGGSGALPESPGKAHVALATGVFSLALTGIIGIYFLRARGLWLLPLGLLGMATVVVYTVWLTTMPLLCLIAPGVGFGTVMVMGTHFVLAGSYSWSAFVASLLPFFLVSNLLLLNQFPDVEADDGVGRRHLPIVIGRKASVWVYGGFLAATYLAIVIGVLAGMFPRTGLLALATVPLAVITTRGAARFAEDIPRLIPYMGRNVVITILTPVLLALGLFIGR
ncbi:MAG TPA: prenyltransferase [Syntrophobacteria bacterium]|nr:prenyltransferase [Syntrophobacteria bacterium]